MSHQIGDRASCGECGRILIYTSDGWKHAGVHQPRHMAKPEAMPLGSVWVGDAPEDDEPTGANQLLSPSIRIDTNTTSVDAAIMLLNLFRDDPKWLSAFLTEFSKEYLNRKRGYAIDVITDKA